MRRLRMLVTCVITLVIPLLMFTSPLQAFASAASQSHPSVADCPSPPAGFDPLHASDAELRYYGLPLRPTGGSAAISHWENVVSHAKIRGCDRGQSSFHEHPTPRHTQGQLGWYWEDGYNWAGWEVNSSTFKYALADWTIPCVDGASPTNSDTSAWVGLGGDPGNLFQAGTYWNRQNRAWEAFYEYVPGASQAIHLAWLPCGHLMTAQIDYGLTYGGKSYYYVADYTSGGYWSGSISFTPASNSAEWIAEASYCSSSAWYKEAKFYTYGWTYAQAGSTFTAHPISYWASEARFYSTDPNGSNLRAEPGPLGGDGMSFSMYWYGYGTTSC
jgi:peptidase A4-like protein